MCGPKSPEPSVPPVPVKLTLAPGAIVPSEPKVSDVLCTGVPLWTTVTSEFPPLAFRAPACCLELFVLEMNLSSPPFSVMGAPVGA